MVARCKWFLVIVTAFSIAFGATNRGAAQSKGSVDLDKSILSQIKDAYRAPYEVPQDLRDELRGYYKNPTPDREAAILKEVHRMFAPTAEQEKAIIYQVRVTYQQWSPEQEARIYNEIEKAKRLPDGTVGNYLQARSMGKLFTKLDQNEDGMLSFAELPESLREQLSNWDANQDGSISPAEFERYYTARLGWLSDQVANGKIDLGLKRGGPDPSKILPLEDPKTFVFRAGKLPTGLPDWFAKLDTDKDGQIAMYEWREAGKSLEDFNVIDMNRDGFATSEEVLRYMAQVGREALMAAKRK